MEVTIWSFYASNYMKRIVSLSEKDPKVIILWPKSSRRMGVGAKRK
jgi:hypothetical protein